MNANQRIGHPSSGLHNQNAHLKKPGIFEVPKSEHLNPATGFANCVVTRVGSKNLYHFSHQVGGTETVSMIGNKLSKAISITPSYKYKSCHLHSTIDFIIKKPRVRPTITSLMPNVVA
jgi:hypothetical protein